jgi:MFS family permease
MATVRVPVADAPGGPDLPPPHPLRERNFRLWLTGITISLLGDQCYLVALPWLVLQKTGSPAAMGTILMAAAIPRAVLMLMGGAISDRISPRKIMMTTASLRTLFVAAIGFLVWFDHLRVWELYALGFGFGVADAFGLPAGQAFLPSLVKREQLLAANSVLQGTVQLTTISGPAPAGILIKALGIAWAFLLDAISFLFIIGALWRLPDPPPAQAAASKRAVWPSILEGLRYVGKDIPLRSFMLLAAIINFCVAGPLVVGLAYLAKTRFGSPTAYGAMLSAIAAGGLLGTLFAGAWRVRRRGGLVLGVGFVIGLCLTSMGLLHRLWMVAGVLLVVGATSSLSNVQILAWIQQRIDPLMRGRVMSVLMLSGFGLMPISLAVSGVLAAWSLQWTFLLAGGAMVLAVAAAAFQKAVREIE